MYQEASHQLPKPQDADKCPRCNAEGFIGSCSSCGYNSGIGLQVVRIRILVFSTPKNSGFAQSDSHPHVIQMNPNAQSSHKGSQSGFSPPDSHTLVIRLRISYQHASTTEGAPLHISTTSNLQLEASLKMPKSLKYDIKVIVIQRISGLEDTKSTPNSSKCPSCGTADFSGTCHSCGYGTMFSGNSR
ncbi:hypothetical protein L207DRAFT_521856 [Hyaloscypha variabilis F]|uniref:Uncharacterized protein n=1 Tax=Hyaloscypha variabilis (strain UAMH 11265 / GT02V1 / F) TaxID=1149755 RepID=A0A2J6SCK1_HYAVF|nr:hypothetical protein L207DRAFT_521856 [Hyaloscypha variabilis F]